MYEIPLKLALISSFGGIFLLYARGLFPHEACFSKSLRGDFVLVSWLQIPMKPTLTCSFMGIPSLFADF